MCMQKHFPAFVQSYPVSDESDEVRLVYLSYRVFTGSVPITGSKHVSNTLQVVVVWNPCSNTSSLDRVSHSGTIAPSPIFAANFKKQV